MVPEKTHRAQVAAVLLALAAAALGALWKGRPRAASDALGVCQEYQRLDGDKAWQGEAVIRGAQVSIVEALRSEPLDQDLLVACSTALCGISLFNEATARAIGEAGALESLLSAAGRSWGALGPSAAAAATGALGCLAEEVIENRFKLANLGAIELCLDVWDRHPTDASVLHSVSYALAAISQDNLLGKRTMMARGFLPQALEAFRRFPTVSPSRPCVSWEHCIRERIMQAFASLSASPSVLENHREVLDAAISVLRDNGQDLAAVTNANRVLANLPPESEADWDIAFELLCQQIGQQRSRSGWSPHVAPDATAAHALLALLRGRSGARAGAAAAAVGRPPAAAALRAALDGGLLDRLEGVLKRDVEDAHLQAVGWRLRQLLLRGGPARGHPASSSLASWQGWEPSEAAGSDAVKVASGLEVRITGVGVDVVAAGGSAAFAAACGGRYLDGGDFAGRPIYVSDRCSVFHWQGVWYLGIGMPGSDVAVKFTTRDLPPVLPDEKLAWPPCKIPSEASSSPVPSGGAPAAAAVPHQALLGGGSLPMAGVGLTGRAPSAASQQVFDFLMLGGRHIDGATGYMNTRQMGAGIRWAMQCGVPRSEVFVTSKILPHAFSSATDALWEILEDAGLEGLDLLLLHFPTAHTAYEMRVERKNDPNACVIHYGSWQQCWQEVWRSLSHCRQQGLARNLGVSNFGREQIGVLQELQGGAPVAVNQLELHPWIPAKSLEVAAWCQSQGIAVTAYCSVEPALGHSPGFMTFHRSTHESAAAGPASREELRAQLQALAAPYNRSVAQLLLRWAVEHNFSVIPGTASPQHMLENLRLFDWRLSSETLAALDAMPATWGTSSRYPHAVTFDEGL